MSVNNASWRFVLARSLDLLPLGELIQARARTLTLKLNDAGSASFTIPMNDDLGYQIQPYTHSIIAYRVGSTGAQAVWSGYVNTIDEDIGNMKMTVSCVGWLQRFSKQFVHMSLAFTATDDGDIIKQLVTQVSNPGQVDPSPTFEFPSGTNTGFQFDLVPVAWPAGSKPNTPTWVKWGGTLPNEGSGGSTAYVPVTDPSMGSAGRNISYTRLQSNILQSIMDLVNLENGCDIFIDPLTRTFYVHRKRMRARDGSVSAQPSVVFGYGWGPENIAQIGRQLDGSTVVNSLIATGGTGSSPALGRSASSQNAYGVIEEMASLSDLSGTSANSNLLYYANAEIALRNTPRQIFSFTPFNWTIGSSIPEPLVDYRIGDLVKLGVRALPRISQSFSARIFGISFSIDDEGNEKIGQLQVSP